MASQAGSAMLESMALCIVQFSPPCLALLAQKQTGNTTLSLTHSLTRDRSCLL